MKKTENITRYIPTTFRHKNLRIIIVLVISLFLAKQSYGQVSVPDLFNDNMVLQRGQVIHVWGKAAPNEAVSVELGPVGDLPDATWNGSADGSGDWSAVLPSRSASSVSSPLKLRIIGVANQIVLDPVHCGDVWLCSGQSNMNFIIRPYLPYSEGALYWQDEVSNANISALSIYTVVPESSNVERLESHGHWRPSSSSYAEFFSAVPYFFGKTLREEYNVPIGIIVATLGGTSIKVWSDANTLDGIPAAANSVANSLASAADHPTEIVNYFNNIDRYYQNHIRNQLIPTYPPSYKAVEPYGAWRYQTSGLFNGMIAPLERFPVKGVAWYQGEGDSKDAANYSTYLHGLVNSWRARRNDPALPFIIVQLANYNTSIPPYTFADLRNAQASILDLPDVALVVTADIGNPYSIHPRDKRTVGERAALAARHVAYNETGVVYTGPTLDSLQILENSAYINFDNTGDGLQLDYYIATGDGPNFEIAGADMVFYPAYASLVDGRIKLSSTSVTAPRHVQYAYHNNPELVLYNILNSSIHLPAAPFSISSDLNHVLEAESLSTVSSGASELDFTDTLLSEGAANILNADSVDDYVEYTLNVPEAGIYNIKIGTKTDPTRGIFQLHFPQSNADVGTTHDLYTSGVTYPEIEIGDYSFLSSGNKKFRFVVTGTNPNSIGCSVVVDYIKLTPNALISNLGNTISLKERLTIYPSPAKDNVILTFHLASKDLNEDATIDIYDILGHKVLQKAFFAKQETTNLQLDVSILNSGLYVIKIKCAGKVYKKKLIIE